MSRLATKYADVTDNCVRCPDRATVHPDGMGSTTDSASVALMFRCRLGHCWTRSYRRADLKRAPAKASAGPRHHVATRSVTTTTPTTTPTTIDHEDAANLLSKAARQPGPKTTWNPTRRLWQPR
jgi:hypothetical protein